MHDLEAIRTEIIAAVASDATLRELVVLKGGNALALVHRIGRRASLDIDYSMADDLDDPDQFASRLRKALESRFARLDLVLFDFTFRRRPRKSATATTWGGYNAEFKLISRTTDSAAKSLDSMRRQALPTENDPQASRRFKIEISKFEFCADLTEVPIGDDVVCRVYSLDLVAAEKLRSLCQQMDEYTQRRNPTPRSRDFYDLHAVLTEGGVDFGHPDLHTLVRLSFDQKNVPLGLLGILGRYLDFHRQDWHQVLNAIPAGKPREFSFYAEFVIAEARKLQPLWNEDSP